MRPASGDVDKNGNKMEPSYWASEHSDALREFIALGLSWSEAGAAINRKFETGYTRNAVQGRARRMGLMAPRPPGSSPGAPPTLNRLGGIRPAEPRIPWLRRPMPVFERTETEP